MDLGISDTQLEEIIGEYIVTLLWQASCRGEASDRQHTPGYGCVGADCDTSLQSLDFDSEHLDGEALASIREDVSAFVKANEDDVVAWAEELGVGQVGHDLMLTRQRAGTGFWDQFHEGPMAARGQRLAASARKLGETHVGVGDDSGDGKVLYLY